MHEKSGKKKLKLAFLRRFGRNNGSHGPADLSEARELMLRGVTLQPRESAAPDAKTSAPPAVVKASANSNHPSNAQQPADNTRIRQNGHTIAPTEPSRVAGSGRVTINLGDPNNNLALSRIPGNVWSRHILSRVTLRERTLFALSCRDANRIVNKHIEDMFQYSILDPIRLFKQAHANGVKLNLPLLHRLFNFYNSGNLFNILSLEPNPSWIIAAICGDIKWLRKHHGDRFIYLTTCDKAGRAAIALFLVIGNNFDILKQFGLEALDFYFNIKPIIIHDLYHEAGKFGYFEISDFLAERYRLDPNETYGQLVTIGHYYAYYGKKTIFLLNNINNEHPLINKKEYVEYATMGGQIETVRLLLAQNFLFSFQICVNLAARFGHAQLLKELITMYKIDPCTESDVFHVTSLHECAYSGSWDCFWLLLPYYKNHPKKNEILATAAIYAAGNNKMDFFRQYFERFGMTRVHATGPDGNPSSFILALSLNLVTTRILVNNYGLDLAATDQRGVTVLLHIARIAEAPKRGHYWYFIADVLNEFNVKFNNQLHHIPDHKGHTLQSFIISSGKQSLFPDLDFSSHQACKK